MIVGRAEEGHRLGERLLAAQGRSFVGRAAERALFQSAVTGESGAFAVLYLHGPGGIGKSRLLRQFADDARAAGRPVVQVDGRTVDPSADAFANAAGEAISTPGVVLLVDVLDRLHSLEGWFRRDFVPELPSDAVVVVASRQPPDMNWRVDLGWGESLRVIALRNLPPAEAMALLDVLGVSADLHDPVLAFAGGHPLALCLAAEVAVANTSGTKVWSPDQDAIATLLSQLVGEVPSPAHRQALEICAHSYATTEELLRVVLSHDADVLFAWLRGLPFIESGPSGVFPHDVVRDALDADLRWRDPQGYEAMHRRIRASLLDQARTAAGPTMLHALMGVIYMHRHGGVMPHYVTWQAEGKVREDIYRPADREAVLAMAAKTEGEESARIVEFWLDRQPAAFYVHRPPDTSEPIGFMAWLQLPSLRDDEIDADPVVAAAWEHSRSTAPSRPGEHLGLVRFNVCPAAYQLPSPVNDLMQIRILEKWLRSEHLAWSYVVVADREFCEPQMNYLDQHAIPAAPTIGERSYWLFAHDWRAVSVDTWLDGHIALELFGPSAAPGTESVRSLEVLSRPEFDTAVRTALRSWRRADQLLSSPLTRSRLVVDQGEDAVGSLKELIAAAVNALADDPRSAHLQDVVATTFFHWVPTQEAAAQRLGLPMSTYRRHLTRGINEICDRLWAQELYGDSRAKR